MAAQSAPARQDRNVTYTCQGTHLLCVRQTTGDAGLALLRESVGTGTKLHY